ncbi:MAG: acetylpolyamine amidohydrolase [Alphaproteobacteria bacterium]|nr:MAG: acetylpolyamine amidohydrolase [Alphaproteobacteria bacterium]
MKTVYSDDHHLHDYGQELSYGRFVPAYEMPRRADTVIARVRAAGLGEVIAPAAHGLDPVLRVHDRGLVDFLSTVWDEWQTVAPGTQPVPMSWPVRSMRQTEPRAIAGRLAYYALDACTPITATSWQAATVAADVALTGAALVKNGARAAFALCRPPGHHASRDNFGGYCFLNNAAIAAQWFRDNGAARVAILDVDYHHGNGTQAIFYDRADVMFASLHGDPVEEYPYFLGFADETGAGAGAGFNRNYPLPRGTTWDAYGPALADAAARIRGFAPDVLVVSLGVDTFEKDPISRFKLRHDDYARIGEAIAGIGAPTLFVMEGGYAVDEIGVNAVNVLLGFEQG